MNLFRREGRRKRLPVVAFAGVLFAFQAIALVGAQVASAAVSCTFAGGVVSVTANADGDSVEVEQQDNGQIFFNGSAALCGVTVLVSNTTAINITGGADEQLATIDLSDNTGASVDWGTINWTVNLGSGDTDILDLEGFFSDTGLDLVMGASGIDLDNDGDLDVTYSGTEVFEVQGSNTEDDIISAAGSTVTGGPFALDLEVVTTANFGDYGGLDGGGGDDTLTGGSGNDTIGNIYNAETGDDTIAGGLGDDSLDGDVGEDTVDYSGSATAVTVNLTGGVATGEGTDTLAGFEDIIGSAQGDTLTGEAGTDNVITPGAGDDTVDCNGADANDTVDFSDSAAGVTVDLDAGTATGDGTDTVTDCVDVQGSDFDDVIAGDDSDNDLFGGAGNDSISGGTATDDSDVIDGEAGSDWVDYSARTDPVTVDLTKSVNTAAGNTAGACNDGPGGANDEFVNGDVAGGETDCINAVENATLGTGDDTFVGSQFNNTVAPNGGQNSLDGGTGSDTIDYSVGYTAGVTVNLAGGAASDDAVVATTFENVIGTEFGDSITGDSGSNTLKSRKGKDSVRGGSGDDTIKAGAGNDVARGGSGDDDLWGQKGNDHLFGGGGDDFCKGGPGKDTLKSCEAGHK
jgi:Ca2+-binding RTX toxin-like protein